MSYWHLIEASSFDILEIYNISYIFSCFLWISLYPFLTVEKTKSWTQNHKSRRRMRILHFQKHRKFRLSLTNLSMFLFSRISYFLCKFVILRRACSVVNWRLFREIWAPKQGSGSETNYYTKIPQFWYQSIWFFIPNKLISHMTCIWCSTYFLPIFYPFFTNQCFHATYFPRKFSLSMKPDTVLIDVTFWGAFLHLFKKDRLSVGRSVHPFVRLLGHPSVSFSICLSVHPSFCY